MRRPSLASCQKARSAQFQSQKLSNDINKFGRDFVNSKGKLKRNWYGNDLRDIAELIGRDTEYEILQKLLSGPVHSSSLALKNGPQFKGYLLLDLAWTFSFRVLGQFAEYVKVELDDAERQLIAHSNENVFENTGATTSP